MSHFHNYEAEEVETALPERSETVAENNGPDGPRGADPVRAPSRGSS